MLVVYRYIRPEKDKKKKEAWYSNMGVGVFVAVCVPVTTDGGGGFLYGLTYRSRPWNYQGH